jgi:hypothetical protein
MRLLRRFLRSTPGRTVVVTALLIGIYQAWLSVQATDKVDPVVVAAFMYNDISALIRGVLAR